MKLFKFIRSLFTKTAPTPDLTPAQRREQFCAKGDHDYNIWSTWFREKINKDKSVTRIDVAGRHCKDCGHWDIAD